MVQRQLQRLERLMLIIGETDQADRIVYTNAAGTEEQVTTLKDGMQFGGDNHKLLIRQ